MSAPTFIRASESLTDYLLQFALTRFYEGDEHNGHLRAYGGSVGFVSAGMSSASGCKIGDLILLEAAPMSKWRLSWLVQIELNQHGNRYLCKSIKDGELCWWENVGLSYLDRKTVSEFPSWAWTDQQFEFNDKWLKACGRHDPFLYKPWDASFNDDGTATIGTRARYDFDGKRPERRVVKWQKATIKSLEAVYLDCVAEHKQEA